MNIGDVIYIPFFLRYIAFEVVSSEVYDGRVYYKALNPISGDCVKFREENIGDFVFSSEGIKEVILGIEEN